MAKELTANFSANSSGFSTAVQKLKTDLTNLNKSLDENKKAISETNKKTREYEKELELLKKAEKENGEATKEQKQRMGELETAIAQARVKAAELKTEQAELKANIKSTTRQLEEQTVSANQSGKSLDAVKSSAKDLGKMLGTTAAGFSAIVGALYAMTASAGAAADDINTLSKQYGLSTEEIQKFKYATDLIDVSLETYVASIARNIRSMTAYQNGTEATVQAYDSLGVAVTDSNGKLRDSQTVYNEVISALGQVEDETERDSIAMTILGRNAQQLNPLILGGADALAELGEQAENLGLILPQESLDNLNAFNDKVDTLKANMNGLQMVVGESFANSFDSFFEAGDDFLEFVQQLKADGTLDEMAKGLSDTLATLVNMLKTAIEVGWQFRNEISTGVIALISYKAAINIGNVIKNTASAIKKFTTSVQSSSNSLKACATNVNVWAIAITAAVAVISTIKNAIDEATKVTRDYNEALKQIDDTVNKSIASTEADIKIIETKANRYEELRKATSRTKDEEAELASLASQLQDTLGDGTAVINEQTGAYNSLNEEVKNYTDNLLKAARAEAERDRLKSLYEKRAELQTQSEELTQNWSQSDFDYVNNQIAPPDWLTGFNNGMDDLWWLKPGRAIGNFIGGSLGKLITGQTASNDDYNSYIQLQAALKDLDNQISSTESSYADLSGEVDKSTGSINNNKNSTNQATSATQDLSESTSDLVKSLDEVSAAYAEQERNGSLSYDTMLKLIDAGYAQCISLDSETGKIKLNTEAYKELAKAKLAAQIAEYDSQAVDYDQRIAEATKNGNYSEIPLILQEKNNNIGLILKRDALQSMYDNFDTYFESGSFSNPYGSSGSSGSSDSIYSQAAAAYKTEADKKIDLIKRELEAKKELRDETIKAIDDEIAARKRLNEDNNMEKQINEVKAQLKYGQLDEFSREQLNKKLQDLYDQKAETEWQRDAQARKDAANATYESQQKTYNAQIDSINQSLQTVQQIMSAMADGSKSVESIINNNNTRNNTANINVVGQAFTLAQLTKAIKDSLMDDIVIK